MSWLLLTVQGQNDEGNKKRVFTTQGKLYLVQLSNTVNHIFSWSHPVRQICPDMDSNE